MDYMTRKACVKQIGTVGTWLGGSRYPRLAAIGIRVPRHNGASARLDRREVTLAFTDLGLMHLLPQHGSLRPAEIEEALAEAGTPEELKQRTLDFLTDLAKRSCVDRGWIDAPPVGKEFW